LGGKYKSYSIDFFTIISQQTPKEKTMTITTKSRILFGLCSGLFVFLIFTIAIFVPSYINNLKQDGAIIPQYLSLLELSAYVVWPLFWLFISLLSFLTFHHNKTPVLKPALKIITTIAVLLAILFTIDLLMNINFLLILGIYGSFVTLPIVIAINRVYNKKMASKLF
jgi:hypothetical protein